MAEIFISTKTLSLPRNLHFFPAEGQQYTLPSPVCSFPLPHTSLGLRKLTRTDSINRPPYAFFLCLGLSSWTSGRKLEGSEESDVEVVTPLTLSLSGDKGQCPSTEAHCSFQSGSFFYYVLWRELSPLIFLGLGLVTIWLLLSWHSYERKKKKRVQSLRETDKLEQI